MLFAVPVVLVLGLAGGGWFWHTDRTGDQVSVAWDGTPRCEGATVATGTKYGSTLIKARRGMRCVLKVVVTNESGHTVRLERAVAPMVGRGARAIVKAQPQPERPSDVESDDMDAYFPLDEELAGGSSASFTIGLGFREQGCSGAFTTFHQWPTVQVRVLGRTIEARSADDLTVVQRGPSSGCG